MGAAESKEAQSQGSAPAGGPLSCASFCLRLSESESQTLRLAAQLSSAVRCFLIFEQARPTEPSAHQMDNLIHRLTACAHCGTPVLHSENAWRGDAVF